MRRSINFGSIFHRKEGLQPTDSKEQSGRRLLLERFATRAILLKEGDVVPLTKGTPALDWTTVSGRITVLASAIEGLLEGRARIRAQQLKGLSPSPIGCETKDSTEYEISLAAVVPQILDLMGRSELETSGQPEFETPFTLLAREDSARFPDTMDRVERQEIPDQTEVEDDALSSNGVEARQQDTIEKLEPKTTTIESGQNDETSSNETLLAAFEGLVAESPRYVPRSLPQSAPVKTEPEAVLPAIPGTPRPRERKKGSHAQFGGPSRQVGVDLARRGVERLQEIFMTTEPLDGRRVASLVQEFPGVNGALILLEGGAVLGEELPVELSMEAALQAPEILKNFSQFINEVEGRRKPESKFVSVTSATTISLVASGKTVLIVSHQGRKLPPGLAQRLAETAEALNLIYGNS